MRRASHASIVVAAAAWALAGCASQRLTTPEPVTTVKLIQVTSYPELPDIPLPLEPQLLPWEYEVPRDLSRLEPKSTPDCEKVTDKERDAAYWARCGQNPVIRDTNVLFGLDQRNWNIMLSNFSKLREYIVQLKSRVDVANESRREWRRKAEEERRRADAAVAPRPAASAP
jgi:hypothetical protein